MISAKVIADSISDQGHRLTTMEVVFPRFILAEVNTHRVISKNSASSRAVPVAKKLEEVENNPVIPVKWAAEQRGMQGGDEVSDTAEATRVWLEGRDAALESAKLLSGVGVHKSIVNRILEPYMYHTAILTATAFQHMFALRANPLAQPEFQDLAYKMKDAYEASVPQEVGYAEWHLPYILDDDPRMDIEERIKVSVARCARVSYLTHDGKRDIAKDLELYDRLVSADPPHSSPLEHVATPWPWNIAQTDGRRSLGERPRLGNFIGWRQHRLDLEARAGLNTYR